ncbi:hypothetical protein MRB53_037568 [Persea americana]|nr:hypothetical protein MRB53_037568 [Persea americana]
MPSSRRATHAGSWYSNDEEELDIQLSRWLDIVPETSTTLHTQETVEIPTRGCALSQCAAYETPLGSLDVDVSTNAALHSTGKFDKMSISVDEDEHSIEMQLPYVHKMLSRYVQATIPSPQHAHVLRTFSDYVQHLRP